MTVFARNSSRFFAILLCLCAQTAAFAQLSAAINAGPSRSGCSPLVVNFSDASTGNPTQWRWDLGNGVISVLRNPSTTYFNPGTYSVKLVVRNAAGTADSVVKTDYITVFPAPATAFTADKTVGCFPLRVSFSDGSTAGTGTLTSWFWDFGDGTTSTLQHPQHVYTAAGAYAVTLRVGNSSGCSKTITKAQYINVSPGVAASFVNSDPGPCKAPSTVSFTNTSTGPGPLSYAWSFGDGGSSTGTSPAHTFTANGAYTITLIATSPQGCADTVRKANIVNIGTAKASFDAPDTVCAGSAVTFSNTASPAPVGNHWQFSNGTSSVQASPSVVFATPGVYTAKLVSDFGGCTDSATKQIYVAAKPQPAFTTATTVLCSLPATAAFTNQTIGSRRVLWDFGDGDTSSLDNPSHNYLSGGSFSVTLTVTNAAGCTAQLTKSAYVTIDPPKVVVNGLPVSGCSPLRVTPTVTLLSSHTISSYLWKFGDGSTSTQAAPSHTYSGTGVYSVTLVFTTTSGCTDSVVITDAVHVGDKPKAAFTLQPNDLCAEQTVSFLDKSTGTVDQWLWIFGDGGTSTLQNPVRAYADTGWFNVKLIVFNNTCPDTIEIKNAVHIRPPLASFRLGTNCTDKYTKTFTDRSMGAQSWFWNFGDGTTSTAVNPVHTYATTGTYRVTLTVGNETCFNTMALTVPVVDEKARISGDTAVCRNAPASFALNGINTANLASWQWDFGDGSSATGAAPSHVYNRNGTYIVSYGQTDIMGCSDQTSLQVNVFGPQAGFAVPTAVSCFSGNSVAFPDVSSGDGTHAIAKRIWLFGDGTLDSSGTRPMRHSYAAPGTFDVSLLVQDSFGCADMATRPAAVSIVQPKADFVSADTLSCTNKPVSFTNLSSGSKLQYNWQFGDGTTSTTANPVHQYAGIGTFGIRLLVTDEYGCRDSMGRPNYVSVSYPKARMFASDTFSTCPPLLVNFSHQSSDYTSLLWDFGDGTTSTLDSPSHFYTTAGTFVATLRVTGPGGCTDVASQTIVIKGPSGSFTYAPLSGCRPLTVNFTGTAKNIASYTWDYADGSILFTKDSLVSHTYTVAGDYLPKIILTDAGGCSVPLAGKDTIKVIGVTAGFGLSNHQFCDEGMVQFANTTVGNDLITGYHWDFGDGTTGTSQQPLHHYSAPGIYTVALNVTSQSGCVDSVRYVDTVKVFASPIISIANDASGCVPLTVHFAGNVARGNAALLQWQWNFGNGQTASVQQPAAQVYTAANAYTISALATDENGCRDTATVAINAYPIPAVNAGADVFICRGSFAQLSATGAATYQWKAAPSLSCTTCANPLAAPTDSTTYIVAGTTAFGCTATDTVTVGVHQPFTLQVGKGDTVCAGTPVALRATGAQQYTWIPATAVAAPTAGITTARPMVSTLYRVIAKDNVNCFTDTASVYIKVWPYPVVNAGDDMTVAVGTSFVLQPSYSADIVQYRWTNPMQSLSCVTCPRPVVHTQAAQNTYRIEVANEGGCVSSDEVTVYAICNGGNLFIPNTFSPNGDGKNEVFFPRGSGIGKIKSLRVFNRWGEMVFSAANFDPNDETKGWNGVYKGAVLPPDVYVYTCEVVCQNNEVLIYNGNVTLLR